MYRAETKLFISTGLLAAEWGMELVPTVETIIKNYAPEIGGIELCPNQERLSSKKFQQLRKLGDEYGVSYRIHTPESWRPQSNSLDNHISVVRNSMCLAAEVDAEVVIQHPPITANGLLDGKRIHEYLDRYNIEFGSQRILLENGVHRRATPLNEPYISSESEDARSPYRLREYIAGFHPTSVHSPFKSLAVDATKMCRWKAPQGSNQSSIEWMKVFLSQSAAAPSLPISEVHLVGVSSYWWDPIEGNRRVLEEIIRYPNRPSLAITLESVSQLIRPLLNISHDYLPLLSTDNTIEANY